MPIFGWDASHYDWDRGSMNLAAAVRDGIVFGTHKIGEGFRYADDRYTDWYSRARAAGVGLLGAYYVNLPGDQQTQADRFLALLDSEAPGWRTGPFVLQVDAEKFDYMDRAPNPTEIRAFCDRLVARTASRFRPVVYAPRWVYGDTLRGLGYPLWASNYGSNPTVHYRQAYPGDGSTRWVAYSGQTPTILQYGSRCTIGSQTICDANAFRGTLEQLRALVTPAGGAAGPAPTPGGDDVSFQDIIPATGNRKAEVCLSDIWNAVSTGHSGYVPSQALYINAQLGTLAAMLSAIAAKVDVDVDPEELAAITAAARAGAETGLASGADAIAERIAAVLVASNANGLTDADHAGVVADVKQALTQGTG